MEQVKKIEGNDREEKIERSPAATLGKKYLQTMNPKDRNNRKSTINPCSNVSIFVYSPNSKTKQQYLCQQVLLDASGVLLNDPGFDAATCKYEFVIQATPLRMRMAFWLNKSTTKNNVFFKDKLPSIFKVTLDFRQGQASEMGITYPGVERLIGSLLANKKLPKRITNEIVSFEQWLNQELRKMHKSYPRITDVANKSVSVGCGEIERLLARNVSRDRIPKVLEARMTRDELRHNLEAFLKYEEELEADNYMINEHHFASSNTVTETQLSPIVDHKRIAKKTEQNLPPLIIDTEPCFEPSDKRRKTL